jgi:glucoamylase
MDNSNGGSPTSAFGHPGIPPTWSPGSKDGVGTAYSQASKIWFTLSMGILTEIYYPTIDHPQIRDAQFLISDGKTFFHEEKRDLDSHIELIEPEVLGYRVTSSDPKGRYQIIKEVISDPYQACVLVHTKFAVSKEWQGKLQLYFLLAPHLEIGGWDNSAMKMEVAGRQILLCWKKSTYMALGCDCGFSRSSCGFVGQSDGWQDLHRNFKMDWEFDRAENGNIAVMGEIDLRRGNEFTVGIAFGESLHAPTTILTQALALPFSRYRTRFVEQWQRVGKKLENLASFSGDEGHLYSTSSNLLLAHEDKTFSGAFIASASIPWGDVMGDEDLGGYHLVWTRDMVNSATGLLACGHERTSLRALIYLACSQQSDGSFPQNFWIDGTPYWKGMQLDEVAFPIVLAWRLWQAGALEDFDPYSMVKSATGYLLRNGPKTPQERWEECSGYSPSTLAACIAALICSADFARRQGEEHTAKFIEDYADFLESHIERWTMTTQGTLLPEVKRHYIRILPISLDEDSPAEDPNSGILAIANRRTDEPNQFPAKDVVDAGFLELVRYGIRKAGGALMEDSLKVVDSVLKVDTPYGPCWRRYNHDGYGPQPDGKPYQGHGEGRAWPLLTGERAHYELAAGRDVGPLVTAMEKFAICAGRGGMLPEQIWDQPDIPSMFMFFGRPCGSAMPLVWAHAEYIRLLRSIRDKKVFDQIPLVAERYLNNRGRKDLEVWKSHRRVRTIAAGKTLRIQSPGQFLLRWSSDGGQPKEESTAVASGLGIGFVDIETRADQTAPVRFNFAWSDSGQADSSTYEIRINMEKATSTGA